MRADELRFRDRPRTGVRFSGSPAGGSQSRSTRDNLPEPVSPGVDYHDVHVTYLLSNRLGPAPAENAGPRARKGARAPSAPRGRRPGTPRRRTRPHEGP
ncbi:hypothetical protein [Streptomyces sp. TS71-3]|uniref:hypothetical protein n=1 Tax=Streptomyces sp. TS71-3 TaxID=2733862 RepID=UPI001B0FD5FD|nr:hypothetical protein [Streptomyces sp. TS71-3]GHJ39297.1 hypothetical protein Sm713_49060 [Streptomyces sp. TS71-3]